MNFFRKMCEKEALYVRLGGFDNALPARQAVPGQSPRFHQPP
ncbi:hypothetical protein CPter291_0251 [Collimonas pratensis]|uniref:Uncharacterized protein n=1 Tax=Collimonas pratensis TaxID=279113 RepID=A0ABM5Z0L9_9BURK|nr:hypothetical protein CPter291_0251 [Collimonas pratensis]